MKKMLKKIALVLAITTLLIIPAYAGGDQPNLPEGEVQQGSAPSGYAETETATQTQKAEEVKNNPPEEEAKAPDMPCVHCESGTMVQTDVTTAQWSIVAYIPCECEGGMPHMKDKQMERTVTITMTCGSCGMGDYDTSIQTKTEHVG